jgi:hypothetical protein
MSTDQPARTIKKQGFQKGASGNPAGRPQGSRNKVTLALEALLDGEGEALTRKAIDLAKGGDLTAMRLCLERIIPARKDRPVSFRMPPIESAADAARASSALVAAVAEGDLTPSEAAELGKLVESYVRTLEANEFEQRLAKLEASNVNKAEADWHAKSEVNKAASSPEPHANDTLS